jgi:hypothetical protein
MPRLYIPSLKDKIRLTAPLVIMRGPPDPYYQYRHFSLMWAIEYPGVPYNWQMTEKLSSATLVEGTVLEFKRYFISAHAKENRVTLNIWAHPRRDLTPKKQGGTATTWQLDLPVEVLNTIEYERVDV